MFLKHLYYIQMCFLCNVIHSSRGRSRAVVSDDFQGRSPTVKTPNSLLPEDQTGTLPTGTLITGTLPTGTLPTDTLPTGNVSWPFPPEGTFGTWPTRGPSGTLPTEGTLETFPAEGSLGTIPTGEATVKLQTGKMPGTFPTSEVSGISFSASVTIPTDESTSGFPFTYPPWWLVSYSPIPNLGPRFANLSEVLEENSDLIETFATEFYSLCANNAEICETKVTGSAISDSISKCCVRCSCTDTCKSEENCCPLKKSKVARYENSKYFKHLFCQSTYKLLTKATARVLYNNGYKDKDGYLFVSTCPDSALEEDKFLCESMARTDTFSVLDNVPVTDITDTTHFANGFCAACHNIERELIKIWNIGISCLSNDTVLEEEGIENFVRRNPDCYMTYMPPDDVSDSTLFSCIPDVVDRCNTFGTWNGYDEKIESLCLDPRLEKIYKVIIDYVEHRFKNVFCAVCNGFKADEVNDCGVISIGPLNPPALHSLFTFSGANVADTSFNGRTCALGTVFIPVLGTCRKVHCIAPYIVDILRNTCVLRAVASPSQRLYLPLKVSLHQSVPFFNHGVLQEAIIRILDSVYPNSCQCVSSLVYELDTAYHPDMTNLTLQDTRTRTLYISLHLIETSMNFDYAKFSANVNTEHEVSMIDSTVKINLSHSDFDPLFLIQRGGHEQYMIVKENPYNHEALVHYPSSLDNCTCMINSEIGIEYPLHFLECPSMLVALEEFDITRVDSGLTIGRKRNTISLNDVRSLNSTHVYICIDSMNGEEFTSNGNSFFERVEFYCTFVLYMSVILVS